MLAYLSSAYTLYGRFFLSEGRPVSVDLEKSVQTKLIKYAISNFNHKDEYDILSGWVVFTKTRDQSQYERFLLLRSDAKTYFFPLTSVARPDLLKKFHSLKVDAPKAGFNTRISSNFIQPGEYRVGILFRHKKSNAGYYTITGRVIIRTPNLFFLKTVP
jgi:hypothetical protein